jgi:hypothetical protein
MDVAQRKCKKAMKSYQLASALLHSTGVHMKTMVLNEAGPATRSRSSALRHGQTEERVERGSSPVENGGVSARRHDARRLLRQLELQRPLRKKRWRSAPARRAAATEEGGGDARRCNLMASGGERQPSNEEDGGAARPNRGERLRSAGSASDSAGRSADSFYSPTRATDIATHDNQSGRDTRALSR